MTTKSHTTHAAEPDARNDHLMIYLNGKIVPREKAVVSVYDSGFMLGDGVWEGIRLHNNNWAFVDAHLDRLYEAACAVDMAVSKLKCNRYPSKGCHHGSTLSSFQRL